MCMWTTSDDTLGWHETAREAPTCTPLLAVLGGPPAHHQPAGHRAHRVVGARADAHHAAPDVAQQRVAGRREHGGSSSQAELFGGERRARPGVCVLRVGVPRRLKKGKTQGKNKRRDSGHEHVGGMVVRMGGVGDGARATRVLITYTRCFRLDQRLLSSL